MKNETITGHFHPSKIENCPVYIPHKISNETLELLNVGKQIDLKPLPIQQDFLSVYLLKFLAGDKNTQIGFADCAIDALYLWDKVRLGSDKFVKNVSSAISRFEKALETLSGLSSVDIENLTGINTFLRPKKRNYGIRFSGMKAGDYKTNPNAFYCIPHELIQEYIDDFLQFYNQTENDANKALLATLQFIFIHPFRDGNGRVSRLLLLNVLQNKYGFVFASLLAIYLKNIDKKQYHDSIKKYRYGDTAALKQFYKKAIAWTIKSYTELHSLLSNYKKIVGRENLNNPFYSEIVIKVKSADKVSIDSSFFQFQRKKGNNNIYLNFALLNVLNQFDYYLRYELRKHQGN